MQFKKLIAAITAI